MKHPKRAITRDIRARQPKRIGREAASLGLHLLKDEEVQDMIVALIKEPADPGPPIPPEA